MEELRQRLAQRMTETSPELALRFSIAREELARLHEFDYRVINRDGCLDQAIGEIDAIIAAEKCRVVPRMVQLI